MKNGDSCIIWYYQINQQNYYSNICVSVTWLLKTIWPPDRSKYRIVLHFFVRIKSNGDCRGKNGLKSISIVYILWFVWFQFKSWEQGRLILLMLIFGRTWWILCMCCVVIFCSVSTLQLFSVIRLIKFVKMKVTVQSNWFIYVSMWVP